MEKEDLIIYLIYTGIILFFVILFYFAYKEIKVKKEIKEKQLKKLKENKQKENIEKEKKKKQEIESKFNKVDILKTQLIEIQKIEIIDISDFKKIIVENEKTILSKGGDQQLFLFMKIDSFLKDFLNRIMKDKEGLNEVINIDWIKNRIETEGKRNDINKIIENLEDSSARLDGRATKGFDANLDNLFMLGEVMKPAMENQIKTMEYYKNIAIAMMIFYLNDKKIQYFDIYEAFEKLGVFDSSWQKDVLNKLDNIEYRLSQISNQLTELNQNFVSILKSSDNIVKELKEINSNIITNNVLQSITAYQTWKIRTT